MMDLINFKELIIFLISIKLHEKINLLKISSICSLNIQNNNLILFLKLLFFLINFNNFNNNIKVVTKMKINYGLLNLIIRPEEEEFS